MFPAPQEPNTMTRTFAAADIGSNTAHLLVAASDGELVMRIDNYSEWVPLGEVVARTKAIPKDTTDQLVLAIKEFRRMAQAKRAESLYVFATEAVRAANNHQQALKRIREETGVAVDVITPAREAELSLRGATLDCRHLGADLMLEVGGGSAQIAVLEKNSLVEEESLRLGTGRVIAEANLANPCPDYAMNAALNYLESTLDKGTIRHRSKMTVACGGVVRGLWRALHPDGEKVLAREEIEYIIWATSRLTTDRIISRFGVKPKRAGTLLPGALIYRALMQRFGASQIAVSEFGVREGAVLEMADGKVEGSKP